MADKKKNKLAPPDKLADDIAKIKAELKAKEAEKKRAEAVGAISGVLQGKQAECLKLWEGMKEDLKKNNVQFTEADLLFIFGAFVDFIFDEPPKGKSNAEMEEEARKIQERVAKAKETKAKNLGLT